LNNQLSKKYQAMKTKSLSRKFLNGLIFPALTALLLFSSFAHAQTDYPNRPVKIVIPFPVGGLSDSLARLYGKELSDRLGQPFIVESRPGASTNIGAAYVASSPNDGYTLLVTTIATNALNKWSNRPLSFDPHGFSEIGMLGVNTLYVMVGANSPYRTVQDIVKAAKENPQGLSYGSFGIGTPNHMLAEMFKQSAGIQKLTHVPYKGASDSSIDLMAGRIDFMIDGATINLANSGKLRALAVTFPKRWPTQPGVPTMAEVGFPDVTISTYFGLAAPPNTPPAILERLNAALRAISSTPDIEKKLLALNVMPMSVSRQEATSFMRQQSEKWGPLFKTLELQDK
jgi:tripartite-type tricarboxylate transporter receptor subunit TctC